MPVSSETVDSAPLGLDAEDLHDLVHDEVRVERFAGRLVAGDEPANLFDDPSRPHRRGEQSLERRPDFLRAPAPATSSSIRQPSA